MSRIKQEDLAFPHPPPADECAALEAAAVSPLPPPAAEDGQQPAEAEPAGPAVPQQAQQAQQIQEQAAVQQQAEWRDQPAGGRAGRKAPPGVVAGSSKELGQSLLEVDARPAALSTLPAKGAQQAQQATHAPSTPSKAAVASAAARGGGAQLGKTMAGL